MELISISFLSYAIWFVLLKFRPLFFSFIPCYIGMLASRVVPEIYRTQITVHKLFVDIQYCKVYSTLYYKLYTALRVFSLTLGNRLHSVSYICYVKRPIHNKTTQNNEAEVQTNRVKKNSLLRRYIDRWNEYAYIMDYWRYLCVLSSLSFFVCVVRSTRGKNMEFVVFSLSEQVEFLCMVHCTKFWTPTESSNAQEMP